MKFATKLDFELFLAEIDRLDLLDESFLSFIPDKKLIEGFIKRRHGVVGAIKDFRKSQQSKANWRKNRWKMMAGINRFHSSTAGKRFHRNMGRFLATRYFRPKMQSLISKDQKETNIRENLSIYELAEILKAITSAKTHSFIELEYYMPLNEEVCYWEFLDESLPALDRIERKLWLNEELDDNDQEWMFRLTESSEIIKAISEMCSLDPILVKDYWNEFFITFDFSEDDLCKRCIEYLSLKFKQEP